MKSNLLFLFLAVIALTSCSKKRITKSDENSTENYSLAQALEEYERKTLDFETFSAKARCKFEDEDKNLTFKTTFRIQKDEIIWISASMFGFEGARAYITPDSVKMINRLEQSYYQESIEKLQDISGLPVDFYMLQEMITGKIVLLDEETASITQSENNYQLQTMMESIISTAWLNDANFQLERQKVEETTYNSQMEITYDDYQAVDQFEYPFLSEVQVSGERELFVRLDFTSVDLNEDLSFPFSINKNYKRLEL